LFGGGETEKGVVKIRPKLSKKRAFVGGSPGQNIGDRRVPGKEKKKAGVISI